jgi:hypothetical protein
MGHLDYLGFNVLGFWTPSSLQYSKKYRTQSFWILNLFPSSGESENTQLNPWTSSRSTPQIQFPI